ncbi:hypothetical protein MBM_07737 [Drepanopeziza brunnea f. sp. 'multigermtubi' MB_m1]|uniref:Uncharacterized protein n=1 Tax=Marssonina brunnea f. sp. multigermtubi (strain MB_m1) TaxID=1072389 RepID=K1W9X6_MARBU|nr:uncharacterized protein MBM_07737 [Drepanopeziza brunnea f. sp. 'multigermtubi' MB_m1]EKD14060.1 hypothetical protein MBM_07737 [Drepanopeziza brunnea f. sp. 'multigermtubi' MB_m1]
MPENILPAAAAAAAAAKASKRMMILYLLQYQSRTVPYPAKPTHRAGDEGRVSTSFPHLRPVRSTSLPLGTHARAGTCNKYRGGGREAGN